MLLPLHKLRLLALLYDFLTSFAQFFARNKKMHKNTVVPIKFCKKLEFTKLPANLSPDTYSSSKQIAKVKHSSTIIPN
jgi:hypothetical protein